MADKGGHVNTDKTSIENTLEIIASELASLKYQQNETRKYLDNKITNFARDLRSDWVETLDKKINILENNIGKHFQEFDHRISAIESRVDCLSARVESENKALKDSDRCIVATGIYFHVDENLTAKVGRLMEELSPHLSMAVEVVATERLRPRSPEHIPVVKVAFGNVHQKVAVLKAKQNLAKSKEFRLVRLRASKSHVERVLEMNFKKILEQFPHLDNQFRIANNGKIVSKINISPNNKNNHLQFATSLNTGFTNTNYEENFPPLISEQKEQLVQATPHVTQLDSGSPMQTEARYLNPQASPFIYQKNSTPIVQPQLAVSKQPPPSQFTTASFTFQEPTKVNNISQFPATAMPKPVFVAQEPSFRHMTPPGHHTASTDKPVRPKVKTKYSVQPASLTCKKGVTPETRLELSSPSRDTTEQSQPVTTSSISLTGQGQ